MLLLWYNNGLPRPLFPFQHQIITYGIVLKSILLAVYGNLLMNLQNKFLQHLAAIPPTLSQLHRYLGV